MMPTDLEARQSSARHAHRVDIRSLRRAEVRGGCFGPSLMAAGDDHPGTRPSEGGAHRRAQAAVGTGDQNADSVEFTIIPHRDDATLLSVLEVYRQPVSRPLARMQRRDATCA